MSRIGRVQTLDIVQTWNWSLHPSYHFQLIVFKTVKFKWSRSYRFFGQRFSFLFCSRCITIFSLLSHIDSVMSHGGVIKLVLCPISLIWSSGGEGLFEKEKTSTNKLSIFKIKPKSMQGQFQETIFDVASMQQLAHACLCVFRHILSSPLPITTIIC